MVFSCADMLPHWIVESCLDVNTGHTTSYIMYLPNSIELELSRAWCIELVCICNVYILEFLLYFLQTITRSQPWYVSTRPFSVMASWCLAASRFGSPTPAPPLQVRVAKLLDRGMRWRHQCLHTLSTIWLWMKGIVSGSTLLLLVRGLLPEFLPFF